MEKAQGRTAAVLATGMVVATVTAAPIESTKVAVDAGRGSGMAQATAAGLTTTTGTAGGMASEKHTMG